MPQINLKRSTAITFTWLRPDSTEGTIVVPAVSIGRYRDAILLDVEAPEKETPDQVQARINAQARILCGPDHSAWLDELDPLAINEVVASLLSVYAGMDPEMVIEMQRLLKKKSLLRQLQPSDSASATS